MIEIIINQIKYKLGKNAKENFQLIDEAVELEEDFSLLFEFNTFKSFVCNTWFSNCKQ
jgi:hypothetical protein